MPQSKVALTLSLAALIVVSLVLGRPAAAVGTITGLVTDPAGAGIDHVCVWLGVVHLPTNCTFTDPTGRYSIGPGLPDGLAWDLFFHKAGYNDLAGLDYGATVRVVVSGPTSVPTVQLTVAPVAGPPSPGGPAPPPAPAPTPAPPAGPCSTPGEPTATLYLPNVTKTLGGADGWQTPFIVQNVGAADTTLEVSFFRFVDGGLVTCRQVRGLHPGTSFADVPNNDFDLPDNTQFAVVVRSFGAAVVGVVNEHRGVGDRAEVLSYVAPNRGSAQVSVPWFSKLANGWLTTMIIQNLGTVRATVTINAVAFDGQTSTSIARVIDPGRSQFVDPRVEGAFKDGFEYALQLVADQPIAVVVNGHHDDPSIAAPMAMSFNGAPARTATTAYLPYVPRGSTAAARNSRVIIQNRGQLTVAPTVTFRSLADGAVTTYLAPVLLAPAKAWTLDLTSIPALRDGEYSLEIGGGTFAAVAAITDATTAMAYASGAVPSARLFLPNVTRTLGGPNGWTTPIVVQSAGANTVTLTWYRFSDGTRVLSQLLPAMTPGASVRIDPRAVPQLTDDRQYAVVLDADGPAVAVVLELSLAGGDGATAYEGIP